MVGYCEREDVQRALQQSSFDGAIGQDGEIADDAIEGLTQWVRRTTRHHFYDSGGGTTLVPSSVRSVSNVYRDVPSSPHAQDRQLFHHEAHRYPVTTAGPHVRIRLPHYDVQALEVLDVRQTDGSFEDWVAASDKLSGPGEDYYLETQDGEFRPSYLYVRASSIGPRVDYDDLLRLSYTYGTDQQDTSWKTVRRSVAMLAAADLVLDEDVQSAVPDNGQLTAVQTKAERYVQRALDRGLSQYMDLPTA